jgi:Ca2+-binding RTX toxin-like protein
VTTYTLTEDPDTFFGFENEPAEVFGLGGSDRISAEFMFGGTLVRAGRGNDLVDSFEGRDTIYGGPGADTLISYLGSGDTISGGGGDDIITGGGGAGLYNGGRGNGLIEGTSGTRMKGGAGSDIFAPAVNYDPNPPPSDELFTLTIVDFVRGEDKLSLQDLADWYARELAAPVILEFISGGAFTGFAGEVRAVDGARGGSRVEADLDGDAEADLIILLRGAPGIDASDFLA